MTNFRVASVDGYGDRDDIALARDRSQGQILENQANEKAKTHQRLIEAQEYATSGSAKNISTIVQEMIADEKYSMLCLKSHIIWDVESISEAVTDACVQLGLGDDEFSPHINDLGCEIEITLV